MELLKELLKDYPRAIEGLEAINIILTILMILTAVTL